MANNRVFIGWSGETNRRIAEYVKHDLERDRFDVTIGGEWRKAFNISSDIIDSMNECDYAIMLIEKEERTDESGKIISRGFNPNVMMELGYLLHKLKNACKVRRILINTNPKDLPSDLQGMWSTPINYLDDESSSESADPEEKLNDAAEKIVTDFFDYIKNDPDANNKLDYFDDWEDNVREIYKFTGKTGISEKLIYGMQAAIYSGDYMRLYEKLVSIESTLAKKDRFGDHGAVACAIAILDVFRVSQRLTAPLDKTQYNKLHTELSRGFEIKDAELKRWCGILCTDKQELCNELHAKWQKDTNKKIYYYRKALDLCHQVLNEIDDMENEKIQNGTLTKPEEYTLLYKSFAMRNISQIHMQLAELSSDTQAAEQPREKQKEYCKMTFELRKHLYEYYECSTRKHSLSKDFISQEYLLSLAEQLAFTTDFEERESLEMIAESIYTPWMERNRIQNMIFEKVSKIGADFLTPNE